MAHSQQPSTQAPLALLPAEAEVTSEQQTQQEWTRGPADVFVIEWENGQRVCRQATAGEAQDFQSAAKTTPLHIIYPGQQALTSQSGQSGLKLVLRGTAQLENYPVAKAALIRAAQVWEALIQNPITVVMDVDYGPTRFGRPFAANTLGSAIGQPLGTATFYAALRNALRQQAGNDPQRAALYDALPTGQLPTDVGMYAAAKAPSIQLRALGLIPPVAHPDAEQENFGDPPNAGFNSDVPYDFDPSNGIDPDKFDFEATVIHEIGHTLGFSSSAGYKALVPDSTFGAWPTVWDFFRFRPGVTTTTFGTAQRILSSGGSQVFFGGAPELAVSTGRPDGTGGDGHQASHWKERHLNGQYIGIMDPNGAPGDRDVLTENDLRALSMLGYQIRSNTQQQTEELSTDDGSAETGAHRWLAHRQPADACGLSVYFAKNPHLSRARAKSTRPSGRANPADRFQRDESGKHAALERDVVARPDGHDSQRADAGVF
jgi:hypothetical protein